MTCLAYAFILCCLLGKSHEANILTIPFQWPSTVAHVKYIGQTLVDKGHNVDMVLPTYFEDSFKTTGINFILYKQKYHDIFESLEEEPDDLYDEFAKMSQIEGMKMPENEGICVNFLESNIEDKLKLRKYDVAIVQTFVHCKCFLILPYKLDIPVISMTTFFEPWLLRSPDLPSFVPFAYTDPPVSASMTYRERVNNLWMLLTFTYYSNTFPTTSDKLVRKYAPEKPFVSIDDLAARSVFWLIDNDILMDYPRPIMPNMAEIAGASTKPTQPLSEELENMIASNDGPVVLVSFGSVQLVSMKKMLKLLEALKMVSSKTLIFLRWTLKTKPIVPDNIELTDWFPQKDLLGHKKTKLFITHGGTNSQMEALYHAVPMITIPVSDDQPYNAKRAEYHGFSKTFDFDTFKPAELSYCITEILHNHSYSEAIGKASAIFRSRPMNPLQVAVHHIEQVIIFGGDHLRAHAFDIPAYQYLMVDIFLPLIFCTSFITLFALLLTFKLCCWHNPKAKME